MWGKKDLDGNDNVDDLTVVFHPEGGFNRTGAFTEGAQKEEYQRQSYLTLEVTCRRLRYARTWGLERAYNSEEELAEIDAENLSGRGQIDPAHYGRYTLSFLGSNRQHSEMDVSIRRSEHKHLAIVPMKARNDLDGEWDEGFSLDLQLDEASFDALRKESHQNPNYRTVIIVKLGGMQGLYTTWSPSISEGRVLKVLDRREDVSNHEDMPEAFKAVGLGGDRLPFTVSLVEKLDEQQEGKAT